MIGKISSIFKTKQDEPQKKKYERPEQVPEHDRCENCIHDKNTCDRISCFTGMMKKLQAD